MFKSNKHFTTPPDETTVYRYMSFWKFVYLLHFKKLYFVRLDHLDDEMEGIMDDISLQDKHKESYLRINKYVNCWHINEDESEAMWKLYGGIPSESIAVKSSVGHIKEAIANDSTPTMIAKIDYDKKPNHEVLKNFYAQVFYKRRIYEHEKELRLCVSGSNTNPPPCLVSPSPHEYFKDTRRLSRFIVDEQLYPKSVTVQVDLPRLIDTVVVGDCQLQPLTTELVRYKGLKCDVTHAIRNL